MKNSYRDTQCVYTMLPGHNEICIVHYEGQQKYDENLWRLSEKTKDIILDAMSDHENNQDEI